MDVLLYQTSCYFHVASTKLLSCLYCSRFFIPVFLSLLFKILYPYIFGIFVCMVSCTLKPITCIIFIGSFFKQAFICSLWSSFTLPFIFFFSYIFLVLADCLHLYYHSLFFIFYYVSIHLIWVIKLLLYKASFPIF